MGRSGEWSWSATWLPTVCNNLLFRVFGIRRRKPSNLLLGRKSCEDWRKNIHRTWNVLTGIPFMTPTRSCIPKSKDSMIRRTTTTVKNATAHDQNQVTEHFSRIFLRLWLVVPPFSRSLDYGENFARILPSFTCFKWQGSEICRLCPISAQIYAFNMLEPLKVMTTFLSKTKLIFK